MNPSVTATPCQLPLAREPFCARYRSMVRLPGFFVLSIDSEGTKQSQNPQTQTGAGASDYHPEPKRRVNLPMVPPGGFSRGEQFERERVVPPLSRLLCILSCRSKKVWPRWQALAESRLENRRKGYNRVSITSIKYQPKSKPSAYLPLAPSGTCGASSLRSGAMGFCLFTLACAFGEVPTVNPSVTFGASSLWQGSLGVQWKTRGPLFSWLLWSSPAFSAVNHDSVKRPGRIFLPGFVSCFCCFFRRVQRRTGKTGTESGTGRGYSAPDSKGRKGLQATATERRGIPRGWSCSGWGSTAPE